MPHDTMSLEFSLDGADEILSSHKKGGDIISAFHALGDAILKPVRRAGGKAVLAAMIAASALLCAPQDAKGQAIPTYLSYSNSLNDCQPNNNSGEQCAYGDIQFSFNTTTGALSGTMIGLPLTNIQFEFDVFTYVGYQPTGWNDFVFAVNELGDAGMASFPGYGITVNNVPVTVYDLAQGEFGGGGEIAWSSQPGTWAIGLLQNPKTLGGPGVGQAGGNGTGAPSSSNPGGSSPSGSSPGTGTDNSFDGSCYCGDPINVATGNLFEQIVDYQTAGQNTLGFTRYYNSLGSGAPTYAVELGTNWRSTYDRYLRFTSGVSGTSGVIAERADGQQLTFTLQGSTWTPDSDVDMTLTNVGSTWTLTDHNDNVETYTVVGNQGILQSAKARNGYTHTLSYNSSNQLQSVTDSYDRSLNFTYNGTLLSTVTTPDGLTLTYGYNSSGTNPVNPATLDRLASITYSTSPATSQTYVYGDSNLPFALTGIIDENNNRYATWTYNDPTGQAITSQHGTGTSTNNLTTFTFNSNGTTTVTNAFGVADTYTFTILQGVPKVTQISRAATSTTAAATRTFGYDTNGYLNSETDWNGNQTTYVNDTHGDPTTINYAVGSPVAYSVGIQYDTPNFPQLPEIITSPGVTSTYHRDGNGNPLSRTDVDTTTTTVPYSTNGQSRETQWTWTSTGQELSVQLPRTDKTAKTQFGYTGGTLTSITDALGHETQITHYTPGGLPKTIIDPNNVTTTNTYDLRLNLHTSTLSTTAGSLTTIWTYNPTNELQSLQLPDGSQLTYGYDTAHRLTTTTDLFNNVITNTLDALGGATLTNVTNSSGTVTRTSSAVFDALDRMTSYIGGEGQTTVIGYDPMTNITSITPPSPSGAMSQTFDALNRLSTHVDPAPGGTTTTTYNSFNFPLSVQDANGNSTSYVYDGFNDRIETASPDSGDSVFYFNPDRDLTKSVLPGSLTMTATFDALDRILTNTYTNGTALDVSRTYDQTTGHGFGVGRHTSATDQVGSLSLTYDERGNITAESRTATGVGTLAMSTTYDNASRVASITYPSTTFVQYSRDIMGRVTGVTATPPGSSASNVVSGVTYEPFGPETALTFGNGATGAYGFDLDYRPTTRLDAGTSSILKLSYAYYANDSVKKITDFVNAANTQTLNYNAVDQLTSATSGTGGYGTFSFTWDPVGNIKTETVNGTETTFHLASGTNRLSGFVTGSTTETIASSPTGNMTVFKEGSTTLETLAYNKANQLASATTTSTSANYEYGLDGRRLEKAQPGDNPILYQFGSAAKELLSENDLHGGTTADYIYLNGRPIGQINPTTGALYFTSTDRLGTPQTLTGSTQAVAWTTTYQPFGATNLITGPLITQSLRFPGQQFDPETGYSRNGFRDYASTLTRYIESDPIGLAGGMNTYQYARGNPFKFTDRRGLCGEDLCIGETGFVIYLGLEQIGAGEEVTALFSQIPYATYFAINASPSLSLVYGFGATYLGAEDIAETLVSPNAATWAAYGSAAAQIRDALSNDEDASPPERPSLQQGCPTTYSKTP